VTLILLRSASGIPANRFAHSVMLPSIEPETVRKLSSLSFLTRSIWYSSSFVLTLRIRPGSSSAVPSACASEAWILCATSPPHFSRTDFSSQRESAPLKVSPSALPLRTFVSLVRANVSLKEIDLLVPIFFFQANSFWLVGPEAFPFKTDFSSFGVSFSSVASCGSRAIMRGASGGGGAPARRAAIS